MRLTTPQQKQTHPYRFLRFIGTGDARYANSVSEKSEINSIKNCGIDATGWLRIEADVVAGGELVTEYLEALKISV